jgi:dihydroorotate dehydrogenase electron transfer subunit
MISQRLKIIRKEWYTDNIFGLEFNYPGIRPWPGQFFQIQVDEGVDPFLNRPVSIASYERARLLMVIKVVGRGTKMLGAKEKGDRVTLFGPFGRKFRPKKKRSLLIAGGIGVAPLHFLAEYFCKNSVSFDMIYGVRTNRDFILRNNLTRMADNTIWVAETGYRRKGTVVSTVGKMDLTDYEIAYTCGPREMLIALQKLDLHIPVYAFCEDFLGCGCGLCLGCAIMYRGEYKRICVDGPILELGEIDFEV